MSNLDNFIRLSFDYNLAKALCIVYIEEKTFTLSTNIVGIIFLNTLLGYFGVIKENSLQKGGK
jgi:hypothetical protein